MLKKFISIIITIFLLFVIFSSNVNAIQGIDVSEWQGYIDYNEVKEDGIEIVYIKASEGTNIIDPYFKTNYDNAKSNGLKVGMYHYLTARTVEEAERQAEYFCSVISGTSPDCRLAMDFEDFGDLSKEEINDISFAFLEKVEKLTGKEVVVYSDLYNAENTFSAELAEKYPLWIAEYEVSNPSSTGKWVKWIGFQYSDTGRVDGISAYVDKDEFTEDILLSSTEKVATSTNTTNEIITYTVKKGDTLSKIASEYDTTVSQIAGLNGIKNIDLIYVGEKLKIDVTKNYTETTSTVHDTKHSIYTVKSGDTLYAIAEKFGVSIDTIAKLNDIQNRNLIYVGERLRI